MTNLLGSCAACHGESGVSLTPGIPSLAGQNAQYLLEKLEELRSGFRQSPQMVPIALGLAADDLPILASHFAGLPYVRHAQATDPAKVASGREAYEKVCHLCHPREGKATPYAEYPLLAGQDLEYMRKTMAEIMSGSRKANSFMVEMISLVPPDRLDAAIHYFASQPVRPDEVQSARLGSPTAKQRRFRPGRSR